MKKKPQVLVVATDKTLRQEIQSALDGVKSCDPVLTSVGALRLGLDSARNVRADIVCIEIERDFDAVLDLASALRDDDPNVIIAAAYRPDAFASNDDESAALIRAIRAGVQDFLRRPASSVELERLLDAVLRRASPEQHAVRGRVVSFVSNKGGVGKSTISLNLACALARRHPDRVLLIDASLQLGVCSPMLGLTPATSIVDCVAELDRLDTTLLRQLAAVHESGLHLLAAPADAAEAASIDETLMSKIISLARRAYDYVVVDTFPMLDGIIMTILDSSDIAYVVLQGTVPNAIGADRLLRIIDQLGIDRSRQRVVANQNFAGFAGNLRRRDLEDRIGRPIDHMIPYEKRILTAMNTGRPLVLSRSRFFGFAKAVHRLVLEVEDSSAIAAEAPRNGHAHLAAPAPPPSRFADEVALEFFEEEPADEPIGPRARSARRSQGGNES